MLLERLTDKEPVVRVQAVLALSKFCVSGDSEEETNIMDKLVDAMSYDVSA